RKPTSKANRVRVCMGHRGACVAPFGVTLISVIWHPRKIPSFLAKLSMTQISSTELMNSANSSETWQMAKKCSCYHRDASEEFASCFGPPQTEKEAHSYRQLDGEQLLQLRPIPGKVC